MNSIVLRIALVAILSTPGINAAAAQSSGATPPAHRLTPADLNGEWVGALELEGGTHDLSLMFQLTDSAFAGAVYDGGQRFGDMEAGGISGDTVRFKVETLSFRGVVTGTTMKVALTVYNGSVRNFTVTKKAAKKTGLSGPHAVKGHVIDDQARPLDNALVEISGGADHPVVARTNAQGEYAVRLIATGPTVQVSVRRLGFKPSHFKINTSTPNEVVVGNVQLLPLAPTFIL